MVSPIERTHLLEYGVVALLIHEALLERSSNGIAVPMPAIVAVIAASVVGAIDESLQLAIPTRVFDPLDMLVNALSAAVAVTASTTLSRIRLARRG
ncbi:MAG: VanZ family protein [Ilumatobacter sp.]|nr:VanZ family protein [Ilumatobacter sp.]